MFSMLLLALSPIYLEELCKGPATLYDSRQLDTAVVDFVSTTVYDYQSYIFPMTFHHDFPSNIYVQAIIIRKAYLSFNIMRQYLGLWANLPYSKQGNSI